MPEYLEELPGAQDVWFEELERVVAHGVTADHSSTFATYCVIEAANRDQALRGDLKGNFYMERRKLAELLGIGGLSGRTSKGATTNPLSQEANPYGALPDA